MDAPQLEKSKNWIERNFVGFGELKKATRPLEFSRDSAVRDAQRLRTEMNGWLTGRNGQRLAVITEFHPELPNLIVVEFIDEQAKMRAGSITATILSPTHELKIGFFNLSGLEGQGFGLQFIDVFRSYLDSGVGVVFEVEEKTTKTFMLALLTTLMNLKMITDWRLKSPLRPKVKPGDFVSMAESDRLKFEDIFLYLYHREKSPLFKMSQYCSAPIRSIRAGLCDKDLYVFQITCVCEPPALKVATDEEVIYRPLTATETFNVNHAG